MIDGTAPPGVTVRDFQEAGYTAPQETQELHRLEKFTFQLFTSSMSFCPELSPEPFKSLK